MDQKPKAAPRRSAAADPETGVQVRDGEAPREDEETRGTRPRADSPAFLRQILDSITDGVIVADPEGRFVQFNPAAERILGIGSVDVPPSEWTTTYGCFLEDGVTPFPPEDLPLARAIRGETVYDCQLFVRNPCVPEGVWLSINSSPLRDGANGVCGGVVVFRDVTAKRRGLERVQMLSTVVEQTADCVIITDRDGQIEYVNPAGETITGFTAREMIGRTPRMLRSGLHHQDFYADIWTTLLEGRVYRGTIVNRKKNGDTYYSEQTITPIRDAQGAIIKFVSVGKDVTDLRQAAERESKLLLARSVQQRLYPPAPPGHCGLEIGANAFTAHETGGDYFDFVRLEDACTSVVIGDVSGHGFDAALVMAETRALLRSIAQTESDPATILSLVNNVLAEDVADNYFVTLLLASWHAPSRTLRYASAGHTKGYVLDASGAVKSELTSTGIPLGILHDARFETVTAPAVEEGDLIVLFTDGVTETEGADGTHFGAARALEVIRAHRGESPAKIVNRLYRAVREFARGRPQTDDITAVVCRVGPPVSA